MVTFIAFNLVKKLSTKFFLQYKVAGLSEIFIQQKFSHTLYNNYYTQYNIINST